MTRVRADLIPIVCEVAGSFAGCTPAAQVSESPDAAFADIDVASVRSVLRNLVDNAIKYSLPDSGPVEVAIEERAKDVLVRVTDDGPGIPETDRLKLFEPFFPSIDRARKGTAARVWD